MFVGTLNLLWGTGEIKTSNKTKENIAEGGSLGVTTHHAHVSQSQKWKQMWQTQEHN